MMNNYKNLNHFFLFYNCIKIQKEAAIMDDFGEEVFVPKPILLGILGNRSDVTYDIFHEKILNPVLSTLGRMPERLILPSEAASSALFNNWGKKMRLASITYETDWFRLGKKAGIVRDNRIVSESTHLIVFLGKRSEHYLKKAEQLAKKGKNIFTVSSDYEIEMLTLCEQPALLPSPSPQIPQKSCEPPVARESKLNKRKAPGCQQLLNQ
jgi:hypothetical protein